MATYRRKHKKNQIWAGLFGGLIALTFYFLWDAGVLGDLGGRLPTAKELGDSKACFHFMDVGQGDGTLITSAGGSVVIDVGGVAEGANVAEYIHTYTESVDYLILTHPHEDHMGGAATVLRQVEVKNVIMPAAASDAAFFSRFLDLVEEKDINVIEAVPGDVYSLEEMTLTILAPLSTEYDDLNNVSVVTRVDVGETSVLFTGDAEQVVEKALLAENAALLDCDLYQVGHHGSNTSSSEAFLEAVSPSAAIISCGKKNSYGHPHKETLTKLAAIGAQVYRTDELGHIIFVSDGKTLSLYQ